MRNIIVNKRQYDILEQAAINELYGGYGDKVKSVKDYLDKNFSRASSTVIGKDGRPETQEVVAWLDQYKQVIKTLTDVQLFYIIQDKFKNILSDKEERDEFLKQVITKWYKHKISDNDSLLL